MKISKQYVDSIQDDGIDAKPIVERVNGLVQVKDRSLELDLHGFGRELKEMLVKGIREVLCRVLPKKALLCGPAAMYRGGMQEYLECLYKRGGVVQGN